MFKPLVFFAILALSFAVNTGWTGVWNVTDITGFNYCGISVPNVGTNVTIKEVGSSSLNMTGDDTDDYEETWQLPWGHYDTPFSNCVEGGTNCVVSELQIHGNQSHASITWYCKYESGWPLWRGVTLNYIGKSEELSEEERAFLSL